jgi:hypothetical protein
VRAPTMDKRGSTRAKRSGRTSTVGSRSSTVGSRSSVAIVADVPNLPTELLLYAHTGLKSDTFSELPKVKQLALHPLEPWVACGDELGKIVVYDFLQKSIMFQPIRSFNAVPKAVHGMKFWAPQNVLVIMYDDSIALYDLFHRSYRRQLELQKVHPLCVEVLSDTELIFGLSDGTLRVFSSKDIDTGSFLAKIDVPSGRQVHTIFKIQGRKDLVVTIDRTGPTYLWNMRFEGGTNRGYDQPIGQLMDQNGIKPLHNSMAWGSFNHITNELKVGGNSKMWHVYRDFLQSIQAETRPESEAGEAPPRECRLIACEEVTHAPGRYETASYFYHPAFPRNTMIGFQTKKAFVEIVHNDTTIEAFDLRQTREGLPTKLKIYTIGVHEQHNHCIVCGTNVGVFVVSVWGGYRVPLVPPALDPVMQDIGKSPMNDGMPDVMKSAVVYKEFRVGEQVTAYFFFPLMDFFRLVSLANGKHQVLQEGHARSVCWGTHDGINPIFFVMNTERIVSIFQAGRRTGGKLNFDDAPQIYVIPDELDEAVSLLGGGPVLVINFENGSQFFDIAVDESKKKTEQRDESAEEPHELTLHPVGNKMPLAHDIRWTESYEHCACSVGEHVHVFSSLPRFRRFSTIVLALGGGGASVSLSASCSSERATSLLWFHNALFISTATRILLSFPFHAGNGGCSSTILLAKLSINRPPLSILSDDLTHMVKDRIQSERVGTSAPFTWCSNNAIQQMDQGKRKHPKDQQGATSQRLRSEGGIVLNDDTVNPHPARRPVGKSLVLDRICSVNTLVASLNDKSGKGHDTAVVLVVAAPVELMPALSAEKRINRYAIPLDHPILRFKLLVASEELQEAVQMMVHLIDSQFHDELGSFLEGHGYHREAIDYLPNLSCRSKLSIIFRHKTWKYLNDLIETAVNTEQWMIKNVTTGLAQDKNVEGLSKLLELCVQAKLWNHAKYVSLYLPRIQQLRAAGFIAKTQRRNNAQLVGNMEAASTMSIVATTGKLRPRSKSRSKKDSLLWQRMPSNDSLKRAWNAELRTNKYYGKETEISGWDGGR